MGSQEMLTAAVRSGADAVYLGLRDFNARRGACNFSMSTLGEAVKYCHIRGVRVYLTLNTVLSDSEMQAAAENAREAYRLGIDAVIVQDLGLARLLHEKLPLLPLHASTQLTVHSPSALPLLHQLGFTQVVTSREMSRDDLAAFCAEARKFGIAVECFVHGALCMSMSGQCYMSAMLGSRSGNRGLCAGPCRLPFTAEGGCGYDLSLKDLSLIQYIDDLRDIGVSSLKIEGRMKRPEYVAAATAVCRNAVDGKPDSELYDTLCKVFSRSGFTDGYFTDRLGPDMFGIRTKDDVAMSAAVINKLHGLYRAERSAVAVCGSFSAEKGKPMQLTVSDGVHTVTVNGDLAEAAVRCSADPERIKAQIRKTGATPFHFLSLTVEIGADTAVSAGSVNALRRAALEELANRRYTTRECAPIEVALPALPSRPTERKTVVRFADVGQIPQNLDGISLIVLPLEADFESVSLPCPIAVDIPRGIQSEAYIASRLQTAKRSGVKAAFCGNPAAVYLVRSAGIAPVFDFSMNLFNSHACTAAFDLGSAANVLSAELKCEQINKINSPVPKGVITYGHLPLMLTRNCPLKNGRDCTECDKKGGLTDRKNIFFPVRCRQGFCEVFNSRPLWLAERRHEFLVDFEVLYFTVEDRAECERVLSGYKTAAAPIGEYTRGLYYRGVE